jgi:hypothetical protein
MVRRYRPRKEFKFWLYHDIAAEARLMEYIDYLLKTRQFARTIRNGLRLMWTLGEGDLSVLFELFPTLRSRLEAPAAPTADDDKLNKMLQEAAKQGAALALLQSPTPVPLLTGSPTGATILPAAADKTAGTGSTMNTSFQVAAPVYDDDGDVVIIRRDESAHLDFFENMMRSCQAAADAPLSADAKLVNLRPSKPRRHHDDDDDFVVRRATT